MNLKSGLSHTVWRLEGLIAAGQSTLLLVLRLIYGSQFVMTGYGKLQHLEKVTVFFADLGIPAPGFSAGLVGTTELVGGMLLVIGFGTRLAAVPLIFSMGVAYLTAHRDAAFRSLEAFTEQAPYPFLLASLILLAFGAGWVSVDALIMGRGARGAAPAPPHAKEHLASAVSS